MRRRTWMLVLAAVCLGAGPEVGATSVAMREPLLEEIARGDPVPKTLRVSRGTLAFWPRGAEREITLTDAQRNQLRRLAEAHAKNEAEPFREALGSELPWMQQIALDGLPQGRVSYGSAGAQLAMNAARRGDVAFVAGFLPELRVLARVPPAPKNGAFISWRAEMAQECLSFLAMVAHDEATAEAAIAYMVEGLATQTTRMGLEGLHLALEKRPELGLTASQKKSLFPAVRAEMRKWLRYGDPDAPLVSVDAPAIAARLDDRKTMDLVEKVLREKNRFDFIHHLALGGHPRAREHTRRILRGPHGVIEGRQYKAAEILGDPSLIPDLEANMRRHRNRAMPLDALLAIGTPEAQAGIERRMEADVRAAKDRNGAAVLEISADRWLQTNPPDPERLRKYLKKLPGIARVSLLVALAKNGATDLFPAIRSYLVKPTIPIEVQLVALRALGWHLKHTDDPVALLFLLEVADRAQRRLRHDEYDRDAGQRWVVATQALRQYGRPDPWAQTYAPRWWTHTRSRSQLAWLLGHVGDHRSIELLRPVAEAPLTRETLYYVRMHARVAIGRIERRLGK